MIQQMVKYFDGEPPSAELRKAFLDPKNPISPYFGFIGNERALAKLNRLDFTALGRSNHACNDVSVILIGGSGCGKTELARRHAKANDLPLVEVSPKSVKTTHDLFQLIENTLVNTDTPLIPSGEYTNFILPPINIFIDEVHALPQPVVQGLLKATEPKDGILVTEKQFTIDCKLVHWILATTDRGKLFDAFENRFSKVIMNMYTREQLAKVVQFNYPHWPEEACKWVAHYSGRIPREALSFAKEMELAHAMNPDYSWSKIASMVANENEIDEYGMSFKRLAVLKALGDAPVAEKRLPIIIGVKQEEMDRYILPWLLSGTDDEPPLVGTCNKGYCLTESGYAELKKRGIPYKKTDEAA